MDLDGRCDNASLALVRPFPLLDRCGRDVVVAVAKLAYEVDALGRPRVVAAPVRLEAERDDAGGVRYPEDVVVDKPGTDVGLVGTAYPPPRAPAAVAWLQVGAVRKAVRLVGPRRYDRIGRGVATTTAPLPLGPVPLRYDLAFGGSARAADGALVEQPENPIGRGFALDPATLVGRPAPELEPPDEVADPAVRAAACFAPIPPEWAPRRARHGTFDDAWARERAPIAPRDADPRATCWSAPGLWSEAPIAPDAPVEVGGVLPEGTWRFRLPPYVIRFAATVDGARRDLPSHLDGFLIDADARRVELTFRGAVRLPRPWDRLDAIHVWGFGPMPAEALHDAPAAAGARFAAAPV
jgi:hypothetical protein